MKQRTKSQRNYGERQPEQSTAARLDGEDEMEHREFVEQKLQHSGEQYQRLEPVYTLAIGKPNNSRQQVHNSQEQQQPAGNSLAHLLNLLHWQQFFPRSDKSLHSLLIIDSRVDDWRPQRFHSPADVWLLGSWTDCILQTAAQPIGGTLTRAGDEDSAAEALHRTLLVAQEHQFASVTVAAPRRTLASLPLLANFAFCRRVPAGFLIV